MGYFSHSFYGLPSFLFKVFGYFFIAINKKEGRMGIA
jgi:hypothetical protein